MDNWKKVCDKVSTTMDLSERKFEKGVATLILSNLGWNDFRGNIKEQYLIEDHAKGYYPDFALFPDDDNMPGLFVELKKTDHKQRVKDVKQIRTYMMLTDCRFCIYFGEKMELFFIKIDGKHRTLQSVLSLDYNPKNPDGNRLLDLLTYDNFDEDKLLRFCEDRLAADEVVEFYSTSEGRQRLYELIAKDRNLSEGAALLLPAMLTLPERKAQGVETVIDDVAITTSTSTSTKPKNTESVDDIINDFKIFSEKSVGVNTTRNYIRHLRTNVSQYIKTIIDEKIESVFAIQSSVELQDCIATLKGNSGFVSANKEKRYFFTASLSKYLEYLECKDGEGEQISTKPQKPKKVKNEKGGNRTQRPPFKFSMIGLSVGDEVLFDSRGWKVKIASDNTVEYKGEQLRMSTFCKKYLPDDKRNKSEAYQGPDFFSYGGKTLADIRNQKEGFTYKRKQRNE